MIDEDEYGVRALTEALAYDERYLIAHFKRGQEAVCGLVCCLCVGNSNGLLLLFGNTKKRKLKVFILALASAHRGLLRIPHSRWDFIRDTTCPFLPNPRPTPSLSTIIGRYIRPFMKMDTKEALHCYRSRRRS